MHIYRIPTQSRLADSVTQVGHAWKEFAKYYLGPTSYQQNLVWHTGYNDKVSYNKKLSWHSESMTLE